jgi:hypothetical protein
MGTGDPHDGVASSGKSSVQAQDENAISRGWLCSITLQSCQLALCDSCSRAKVCRVWCTDWDQVFLTQATILVAACAVLKGIAVFNTALARHGQRL